MRIKVGEQEISKTHADFCLRQKQKINGRRNYYFTSSRKAGHLIRILSKHYRYNTNTCPSYVLRNYHDDIRLRFMEKKEAGRN
jgi:hypothetical protein